MVERGAVELQKRGYSDDELESLYRLGRFFIENGDLRRAEIIMRGLHEAAPEFILGVLGTAYIEFANGSIEAAQALIEKALKVDPQSTESLLFFITCLLHFRDYNSAGTYLGEVGELIDAGHVNDTSLVRFYRTQLARYQARG